MVLNHQPVFVRLAFTSPCKNRDTRRESPAGAGAGRTADHLAVLFSQKVLAVRKANDIYRPVSTSENSTLFGYHSRLNDIGMLIAVFTFLLPIIPGFHFGGILSTTLNASAAK